MAEYWQCNECEILYDETDGDMDERMCNKCLDKIYFEELKIKSNDTVKSAMNNVGKLIDWIKRERRKQRKNDREPTTADKFNETWIKSKEKNDD